MSIQLRNGLAGQLVDRVLEDLLVRFVVNVPDEDLSSIERVFFQVEEAQWFYTDFIRQLNPSFPGMKMKLFSEKILDKAPLIWKWGDPADSLARFGKYKSTIPVRGVAFFNKDLSKVVLVKGMDSNLWSFPRGKISKDESDLECAVREAEEETGFNCRHLINENDVVERTIKGKNYKIYLVKNVPEDFNFAPVARGEISKIEWHPFKSLQKQCRQNSSRFFIVDAVLKPLTRWVNKQRGDSNDEELMLAAELKLKELLGVNQPQSVDAGRELLDILQGVKTDVQPMNVVPPPTTEQFVQLPSNLQTQIPFYQPPPPPGYAPMFFPPPPVAYGVPTPVAPSPKTEQRPESKELLSILNGNSKKPSQASSFLGLLNGNGTAPVPSNEIEKNLHAPSDLGQKVKVLKRPTSNASGELLALLGKPKSALPPNKNESKHESANLLLKLINRKPSPEKTSNASPKPKKESTHSAANELLGLLKPQTPETPNHEPNKNASKELLGLLNKPYEPKAGADLLREPQPEKPVDNSASQELLGLLKSPGAAKSSASSELLGLLKKPEPATPLSNGSELPGTLKKPEQSQPPLSKASHELLGLLKRPEQTQAPPQNASHELLGLLKRPEQPQAPPQNASQELLGLLKKEPTSTLPSSTENFEDFEEFEDFEDFDHPSNSPEQLAYSKFDVASDDEFQLADEYVEQTVTEPHGVAQATNGALGSPDYSSIYGNLKPATDSGIDPTIFSPPQPSQSFLGILGQPAPSERKSSARDILNVLKGGA